MIAILVSVVSALSLSSAALAQYVPVDFSSQFNGSRNDAFLANGGTFPTGPQLFTHNTDQVPVNMGGVGDLNTPWAWFANSAANGGPAPVALTVNTNIANVTSVFTMINTFWGANGNPPFASITFNATNAVTQTFSLIGNDNIRDYNQFVWTNVINNTNTREIFNNTFGQRLDMQRFDLSAAFATETLTSIVLNDAGFANFQRSFISGITALQIPAPTAAAALTLAGLAAARRRRA